MNTILVLASLLSLGQGSVLIVNNVGLRETYEEPTHVSDDAVVYMGQLENCTSFVFQRAMTNRSRTRYIMRREIDFGSVCLDIDQVVADVSSDMLVMTNDIFLMYTAPGWGDSFASTLVSTPQFEVVLLALSGNAGRYIPHLVRWLTLRADVRTQLFVLVVNGLDFSSEYDRKLFTNILRSRQIVAVLVGEGTVPTWLTKIAYVIPSNGQARVNADADAMLIRVNIALSNDSMVSTYSHPLRYDYSTPRQLPPKARCYWDGYASSNPTDVCMWMAANFTLATTASTIRHLVFPSAGGCDHSFVRNRGSVGWNRRRRQSADDGEDIVTVLNETSSDENGPTTPYPSWFVRYLIGQNAISNAATFRLLPYHQYLVLATPFKGFEWSDGIFYERQECAYSDTRSANDPLTITPLQNFAIKRCKDGTPLPLSNMARCYHLISNDPDAQPLGLFVDHLLRESDSFAPANDSMIVARGRRYYIMRPTDSAAAESSTTAEPSTTAESTTADDEENET